MERSPKFYALVDYEDDYVQPLILKALQKNLGPSSFKLIYDMCEWTSSGVPLLQWRQYEQIDFDGALGYTDQLVNSYVIRKALIRKHYLSNTITHWVAKHADSSLKEHWKVGVEFELDYAEFLDDALVDAFELRESFEKNEGKEPHEREWWILKAGMADRGQGIRLFSTFEELEAIFQEWEDEEPEDDHDDPHRETPNGTEAPERELLADANNAYGTMTSQLRHFVAQPYIHPPLLLASSGRRKFHIRTYVLAVRALKVYVYQPMLALFAVEPYDPPWQSKDLRSHLTNTCLQGSDIREGSVRAFWDLEDLSKAQKDDIFGQVCTATGEVFEAAARVSLIHFQPLPNAFEIFGLDFMVDVDGTAWLLEVNSFPDFRQTGEELQGLVQELLDGVVNVAIKPFVGLGEDGKQRESMVKVLDLDLGRG
jgi:hypothetical protein